MPINIIGNTGLSHNIKRGTIQRAHTHPKKKKKNIKRGPKKVKGIRPL